MPYDLKGRLLEVCTCGAQCPCQPGGQPDDGNCDAVNAWHIDHGTIDGTDVAGLTLVALSHIHGHVMNGRPIVFYLDDRATALQELALLNVWTGKLGGPLADLAPLIGQVAGVERAAIAFQVKDGKGSLKVGQVVEARLAERPQGGMGHGSAAHDDVCTTVPGSKAQMAEAAICRVNSPTYRFDLDLPNHQVMQGRFHFEG